MSQPDVGDVHVNGLLSQISIAHYNEESAYVADQVFPLVYVQKQTDIYPVYTRGFFMKDLGNAMLRAPGTPAATTGFNINTSNTYRAANYAIGFLIPDELRANQDAPFDMDRDGTLLVTQLQMIRRERAFAADFMAGSVWGTTVQGTVNFVKWSDYGGSDPLTDLRNALRTVQLNTGRRPNKIVMGQIVWDRLVDHPDLIDRIKGGATSQNPAIAQPQLLAALLNLDEVLIGQASYDSAVEGGAFSGAMILDDDLLMLYTPRNPGLLIPAAGYTFVWESMVNGRQAPQFIRKVRLEREKADVVEAHAYWDQVATETQSGYFFQDAVD